MAIRSWTRPPTGCGADKGLGEGFFIYYEQFFAMFLIAPKNAYTARLFERLGFYNGCQSLHALHRIASINDKIDPINQLLEIKQLMVSRYNDSIIRRQVFLIPDN